jgi:hypothetical protein
LIQQAQSGYKRRKTNNSTQKAYEPQVQTATEAQIQ